VTDIVKIESASSWLVTTSLVLNQNVGVDRARQDFKLLWMLARPGA
jgi:hypothetical protein